MASLAGAFTTLGLVGLSTAAPVFNTEYATSPKPYTVTFTQQGLNGAPVVRHTDYTSKASLTDSFFDVSDTASLSATESPVDSQEITSNDTARVSVVEVSQLFNNSTASDTASILLSESVALTIAGVTDKPVTDTASISVTESVVLDITIDVTDTASLTLSESSTVDVSVENLTATDTASISITEESLLNVFAGVNTISVADTATLTSTDSARVVEVGRVRRVLMEITHWRAEMEIA